MRISTDLVVLATLLACGAQTSRVYAECVVLGQPTVQSRLYGSDLVFLADVLGVETVLEPDSFRYRVRFRVVEAYKGIGVGERVIQFRPTTTDDFVFKVRQRVLVYAYGSPGNESTQCTDTHVVSRAAADMRELRRLTRK